MLVRKYTNRANFYKNFNNFNNNMINQINFERKTLLSIIEELNENDFSLKIKEYCNNKNNLSYDYLSEEDNKIFLEYCELLGRSDKTSQNKHLLMYEKIINENLSCANREEKEKKTLYIKMGLMIGLILFIIII